MPVVETYGDLFTEYVIGGVRASLAQVRAYEYVVPDAVREQAWHVLSFALDVDAAWEVTKELLLELAPKMEQQGLWASWIMYLENGIDTSQIKQDKTVEAKLSSELGYLYQRCGRLNEAQELLEMAVRSLRIGNDTYSYLVTLNRLANLTYIKRDYAESQRLIEIVLASTGLYDPERANSLFIRGKIAYDHENNRLAQACFDSALTIWNRVKNERRAALCIQNLGRICADQREFTRAISHYLAAIEIFEAIEDPVNRAVVQMNLGVVYSMQEHYHNALNSFLEAENVFREVGDNRHLAMVYNNQGVEYNNLRCWTEAEHSLQKSIELWQQLRDVRSRLNTQGNLGITRMGQGQYELAVELFVRALEELKHGQYYEDARKLQQELEDNLLEVQRRQGTLHEKSDQVPCPSC